MKTSTRISVLVWTIGIGLTPFLDVAIAKPSKVLQSVQVFKNALSEDPLTVVSPRALNGVLTYDFPARNFSRGVTVRMFRDGEQQVVTYLLKLADPLKRGAYDAQRSSSGRYISFKYGNGAGFSDSYKLCVFDTQTNTLKVASEETLHFRDFFFSPNGRYIALVEGGNYWGQVNTTGASPLKLLCYDVAKDVATVVPVKKIVPRSLTWSPNNVLYFSAQVDLPDASSSRRKPDLYAFVPGTTGTTRRFSDCYLPRFSVDGKKVAFFGSEDPAKPFPLTERWQTVANYMALSVANLDGTERITLTTQRGLYSDVVWSGSGRTIYELKLVQASPRATLVVTKWNLQSRTREDVATLVATDYEAQGRDNFDPQISLIGLSGREDKMLFSVTENVAGDPNSPILPIRQMLQVLDPTTGTVTQMTTTRKSLSYHWKSY